MKNSDISNNANWHFVLLLIAFSLSSCSDNFLDPKPSSNMVIPTTLEDCQRLLDNVNLMSSNCPVLGQIASDETIVDYDTWQSNFKPYERNAYIWADDIYSGENDIAEWNDGFKAIYTCNAVLDVLDDIEVDDTNKDRYDNIKGTALFYRAFRYFLLTEVFTMPYNAENAESTLGLPLRLSADINYTVPRSNLKDTFTFIINDLEMASSLLIDRTSGTKNYRPSKSAALAELAKIYLVTGDFPRALDNAESSLTYYNQLLDYNKIDFNSQYPFVNNPEIIFRAIMYASTFTFPFPLGKNVVVDNNLYNSYATNDIRKAAFFVKDSLVHRKYLYSETGRLTQTFAGLATDEIYLIKSECLARSHQPEKALETLNALLVNRHYSDTYQNLYAKSEEEVLNLILEERRKELVFRGIRWSDVRRLNAMGANIIMRKELNGQGYSLDANSEKFSFPIPNSEIRLSGLEQNPR